MAKLLLRDRLVLPLHYLAFSILLLLTSLAYLQGLHGDFLFDDFQVLQPLGDYGGVKDGQTLLFFLQSGHAGPSGRPVSLLSFLLNASNWPAEPYAFKLTNLILHLLCGVLLFMLMQQILRIVKPDLPPQLVTIAACVASGWWLLHPLHVSTTLYVVQRMAQLATLFTLLGLLGYLHGRRLLEHKPKSAYLWMSSAVIGCGGLAALSKENGALLPLLLLVTELWLLKGRLPSHPARLWQGVFLWAPSAAILAYLVWVGVSVDASATRPFSIMERLLTQARIFWDYLYQLAFPRLDSGQFFGDDLPISRSLINPVVTLPAVAAVGLLAAACLVWRKRLPLASFALLFFLAAHLVESTTIPLELYFEHRNYLPALFLALPLTAYAMDKLPAHPRLIGASLSLLLVVLALLTWQRAAMWADTDKLYLYWAEKQPYSVRAQTAAIDALIRLQEAELAARLADSAVARNPDSLLLKLQWVSLPRPAAALAPAIAATLATARNSKVETQALAAIKRMTEAYEQAPKRDFGGQLLHPLIEVLLANPNFARDPAAQALLHQFQARIYLADGKIAQSWQSFSRVPRNENFVDPALLMVSLLATQQRFDEALKLLREADKVVARYPSAAKQGYYAVEIKRLEAALLEDLANQAKAKHHEP